MRIYHKKEYYAAAEIELQKGTIYDLRLPDRSFEEPTRLPAWIVSAPEDCRILVRFVTFELQNVDDTLVIGRGSDFRDPSTFFARFSGLFPRRSIILPSRKGWLWLNSTQYDSSDHRLHIELEAIQLVTRLRLSHNETLELSPPGYPINYPSFADISWVIAVPIDKSVVVRFKDVDLESYYDKIIVGTGSDIRDHSTYLTLISDRFNQTETPTDVFVANETFIWLTFQTDNSKTFRGFLIQIFTQPELTEEFITDDHRGPDIELGFDTPVNLASLNYPRRYPRKQNITWYITPPINASIRVDVISCHMEKKHDFVRFGSQADANETVTLSGSSTPLGFNTVYPVNESVRIHFVTDYSISFQGFWLRIVAQHPVEELMSTTIPGGSGGPKAVANENKVPLLVPLLCAVSAVVLLSLVCGSILMVVLLKRRRSKPNKREQHLPTHFHNVNDGDVVLPSDRPSQLPEVLQPNASDSTIPIGGVSVSAHVEDSHYDEVGLSVVKGGLPTTSECHVYSDASVSSSEGARGDDDYSKISNDYATMIANVCTRHTDYDYATTENDYATTADDDYATTSDPDYATTTENDYASCDGSEMVAEPNGATHDFDGNDSPHYSTTIEKGIIDTYFANECRRGPPSCSRSTHMSGGRPQTKLSVQAFAYTNALYVAGQK